jgi:hypothetical protein
MATWYLCQIRYQKQDNAGAIATINEVHLIDSVSFTEAEARAHKQIVTGASDFSVMSINRMRLAELFGYEEGEKWFKVKVVYHLINERSGKEKKVVNYMLVNADGIEQALERIVESLSTTLVSWEITDINLTPILDVFPYVAEEEEEEIPANLRPLAEVLAERATDVQPFI